MIGIFILKFLLVATGVSVVGGAIGTLYSEQKRCLSKGLELKVNDRGNFACGRKK